MYDNNIKLLELNKLKHKIESLDIIIQSNQLIAVIKMTKESLKCPMCNSHKIKFNSYRTKKTIHSISTQKPCIIHFKQRRYQCLTCGKTFSEFNPFVAPKSNISHLTKLSILDYLKDFNHTFTDTAKLFNVSIQSVIDIFDKSIDVRRRMLPEVICIDEVFTSKMNKYKYACVLLDFKLSKLIDVITTRHKNYLIEYFSRIPQKEKP